MVENAVLEKSFDFAVRIIELSKYLMQEKREFVLSKQVLRSGTAYWLLLLYKTSYLAENQYASLKADTETLLKLLVSIIKSSKQKRPQ